MKRLLAFLFFLFSLSIAESQQLIVDGLRCEYKKNPLGIDSKKPMLSWELKSTRQGVAQTAYRILVSNDSLSLKNNIGNVWDSRKTNSAASIQVAYSGTELLAAKKYYWKIMAWDNKGQVSAWSNLAQWQMGLPEKKDWLSAQWIAYDIINDTAIIVPHAHQGGKKSWGTRRNILPLLRKEFRINKTVKNATAFICGLGHFEMSINGEKTGDHFLDPGWTNYSKHAQYVSFDISDQLKNGNNAIGVIVGNGFYYIPGQRYRKMTGAYGLPKMILRMVIEYADGTTDNIVSDESWKTSPSPVIFSSIFGGEDYDASLEQRGWDKINFPDKNWKNVVSTSGPALLESQMQEPVKIMQRFDPVKVSKLSASLFVYDLAQNFSGIPSIAVRGSKGDTVRITPAELINADGTANQKGTGSPSYFTYIIKGEGEEQWQPKFSYYGFRYLQVQLIAVDTMKALPLLINIGGLHTRNAANTVGEFTSSNQLFNQTNKLIDWSIKSNMSSVLTDCPHREKLGWLEETHLVGPSIQYNYDIANLFRKTISDMKNAQYPDGKIPEIAPEFVHFTKPFDESPEWGSAAIILPWYQYKWYGDKQSLMDAYAMMKGYINYLDLRDTNYILTHGLSDWYDIGPNRSGFAQMTRSGVTATAIWYYDLILMKQVATLLQHTEDAKEYQSLATKVRSAFNQRFFDPLRMEYDSGSQTSNGMALYMGLVEEKNRNAVINSLVKRIVDSKYKLTAGDIGHRYLIQALQDAGRSDIVFSMNNRDDVPGYGYQLKHGATALTESWQAIPEVSNNHLMLGQLMEWFYAGLAGIKQQENSVAFKRIEIKPQPVGDVKQAAAVYHCPYGEIKSSWTITNDNFILKVSIPVNTTATIYLPGSAKGISTGSGDYSYSVKIKK